jgi:hypothetical protein
MANKLSLNVAKTEFMLIGSKRMIKNFHPNIIIENKQIKQVYECKTLGIIVDQRLSWKSNTENVCKKITSGISALRRVKPFVNKDTLISIYKSKSIYRVKSESESVPSPSQTPESRKNKTKVKKIHSLGLIVGLGLGY